MPIDLKKERPVSLSEAAELLPVSTRTHKPLSTSAIARWCLRGLLASDGARIRLEHLRTSKLFTTREALERFTTRLACAEKPASEPAAVDPAPPRPRPRRSSRTVADELDAAGF